MLVLEQESYLKNSNVALPSAKPTEPRTVLIHHLSPDQILSLQTLFPYTSLRTSSKVPSSGLPYLESLTDLTADYAFAEITRESPDMVYVAGDAPQLVEQYPRTIWNIECLADQFNPYPLSSCTHQLKDTCTCAGVPPQAYLFVHTLYYYRLVDVARALYSSVNKYAYSVHHPFRGARGSLGFNEVQFETSHGRVSTTRFPSFERSDLSWIYTKSYIELFQEDEDDKDLHLFGLTPTKIAWTLSWEITFDSKDIQVVKFSLHKGRRKVPRPILSEPTIESIKKEKPAYGEIKAENSLYFVQIWNHISVYQTGYGQRVYTLAQFSKALNETGDLVKAFKSLNTHEI